MTKTTNNIDPEIFRNVQAAIGEASLEYMDALESGDAARIAYAKGELLHLQAKRDYDARERAK